ncbi:MAG: hypothetical protein OEM91_00500 [Hyphomicrobiales bacterium]|nr:hypothetical protein [Hyphomicrobiales bacterium]
MTGLGLKNLFHLGASEQAKECDQQAQRPSLPADVPENAREAYAQAHFLVQRSPRASGALSRYCLQQMVHDFWQLSADEKGTLSSEFKQISDRLSLETLSSIECIREYGSIDSQLSQDRDMMVDTTVDEAKLLIALVQLLIQEWYMERSRRQKRCDAIRQLVEDAKREPATNSIAKDSTDSESLPDDKPLKNGERKNGPKSKDALQNELVESAQPQND